jgi:hypothetical protein
MRQLLGCILQTLTDPKFFLLFEIKLVVRVGTEYLVMVVASHDHVLWLARDDESG